MQADISTGNALEDQSRRPGFMAKFGESLVGEVADRQAVKTSQVLEMSQEALAGPVLRFIYLHCIGRTCVCVLQKSKYSRDHLIPVGHLLLPCSF